MYAPNPNRKKERLSEERKEWKNERKKDWKINWTTNDEWTIGEGNENDEWTNERMLRMNERMNERTNVK